MVLPRAVNVQPVHLAIRHKLLAVMLVRLVNIRMYLVHRVVWNVLKVHSMSMLVNRHVRSVVLVPIPASMARSHVLHAHVVQRKVRMVRPVVTTVRSVCMWITLARRAASHVQQVQSPIRLAVSHVPIVHKVNSNCYLVKALVSCVVLVVLIRPPNNRVAVNVHRVPSKIQLVRRSAMHVQLAAIKACLVNPVV